MADPITREQVERAMDVPQPDPLAYADSPVWDDGPMLARPVPEAVPQPEPWHARLVRLAQEERDASKACAEAEDAFKVADAEREKVRKVRAAAREACDVARKALTAATTAAAIVEAAQQPAPAAEPTRLEPRYKVGDWVRVVTGPNSAGRTTPIRVTCVTSAARRGLVLSPDETLALITRLRAAEARIERVGAILSGEGCDCYCGCDSDGHNADCDLCLACRIDREVSP